MAETIGRTFYFEKSLWSKLDDDARRCLRSSTKQMEAILKTYFDVGDVELSQSGLQMLGELLPTSQKKTPVIETGNKKKRIA